MAALCLLGAARPASAQASDSGAAMRTLHLTAQAEIEAGSLARSRGVSPEVRRLAELAVRDTQACDRRLLALAAQRGVSVQSGEVPGRGQIAELHRMQGAEFDRAFLRLHYGISDALLRQMDEAARSGDREMARLVSVFAPVLRQDQFLGGWCLGHCLPENLRARP